MFSEMAEEEEVFTRLVKRRKKCQSYLGGSVVKLSPAEIENRLTDIQAWENQVAEMWTRLEMDCRKGDPSAPLKQSRTPTENWMIEKVAPFFFLAQFAATHLDTAQTENKT